MRIQTALALTGGLLVALDLPTAVTNSPCGIHTVLRNMIPILRLGGAMGAGTWLLAHGEDPGAIVDIPRREKERT